MKKKAKKRMLKRTARAHAIFVFGLFFIYLSLTILYSPAFLISDVRNKFSALADYALSVNAKVLGPPAKPTVSAQTACINDTLKTSLDWSIDENTKTFDITRNGSILITGLLNPRYNDRNIITNTSYTYVVIARGPMGSGSATSNSITVKTPEICGSDNTIIPKITVIGAESSFAENKPIIINTAKPLFLGTTNIPFAIITISLHSSESISAQIIANENGYWTWSPNTSIQNGDHIINIIARDPEDLDSMTTTSLNFSVIPSNDSPINASNRRDTRDAIPDAEESSRKQIQTTSVLAKQAKNSSEILIDFSLQIGSTSISQGKELSVNLHIIKLPTGHKNMNAETSYRLLDEKGNILFSTTEKNTLKANSDITKNIQIPNSIEDGRYRLQAEIHGGGFIVSKELSLEVKQSPLINLGGGIVMTYPQILSKLGTIALALAVLLIIWLFLFWREYWLYVHAIKHITERSLEKIGFFSRKKERGSIR